MDNYVTLRLSGEKTYGGTGYSEFSYKVVDDEGYTVESGMGMTDNISVNDKFKYVEINLYDIEPGKHYTVILSDYVI